MRPAPAPRPLARLTAVQNANEAPTSEVLTRGVAVSGASETRFVAQYDSWQLDAKAAARSVGVARFTANMFALTAARVRLTIEEEAGGGEWVETEDPRLDDIMGDYRNGTLNQTSNELMRLHAWHYQVAGEGLIVNRDDPTVGGAEWLVMSTHAANWDQPTRGMVTISLTPGATLRNGQAFAVPRPQAVRYWMPDEEYAALPVSPMTAAMEDLRRWQDLSRYARRVALNYLAMAGLLWTPKVAHENEEQATEEILALTESAAPQVQEDPLVRLYQQIASTSIATDDRLESVTPTMVWWGEAGDQPVWVQAGRGLDEAGIAHRAEALSDWARSVDAPAALVAGGGTDMSSSHWGAWLTEERFLGSVAPLLDRMTHQDLTVAYLAPLLRLRGVPDVTAYRVGFDATEVVVHPDKSDLALRAFLSGLLMDSVALREMGWDPDTDLADEASLERLAAVLSRFANGVPDLGGGSVTITPPVGPGGPAPADGPTTTEGPPPVLPPVASLDGVLAQSLGGYLPETPYVAPYGNGGRNGDPWVASASPSAGAHLARVRTDAQKAVTSDMRRYRRAMNKIARLRRDTARRILAGAEVAFAEALRLAGIRAIQKGRNRNRTLAAAIETAWRQREPIGSHLAALGVTEEQLLAGAFDSYEEQVREWLAARSISERQILADEGFDPDYVTDDSDHEAAAAGFLALTLMALARQRILTGTDPVSLAGPGEVSGAIPAQFAAQALRVADGTVSYTRPATPDMIPTLHPNIAATGGRRAPEDMLTEDIRDRIRETLNSELVVAEGEARERLEEAMGEFGADPTVYVWTHGFYGDPTIPFDPHLDLNGYETNDPEGDPRLYNPEAFPEGEMYAPGDHLGCTCEWVALVSETAEATATNALGPGDVEGGIPGGAGDESALARDLRAEVDLLT